MPQNALFSFLSPSESSSLESLTDRDWKVSDAITLERDWLGRSLIRQKGLGWSNLSEVRSLWTPDFLYFRLQCWFERDRSGQDRVTLFLRPASRTDYFQVELASSGEVVDAHVHRPRIDVDYSWSSKLDLECRTSPGERIWRASLRIPFGTFLSPVPILGEAWRFNVVRTISAEVDSEFLSWRPTFTPRPDPHVPSCFGVLIFLGSNR